MFSSVLGQQNAMEILRVLHQRRLRPSFLLFVGPSGVGKKKAALEFARSILCERPDRLDGGCGFCPSCERVQRGSHPNIAMINTTSKVETTSKRQTNDTIKIEVIREAIRSLNLRPFQGGYSISILDEAETMTAQAQNAALKFLEESPKHVVWIWLVTAVEQLLATIQSRANFKIYFPPLGLDVVADILMESRDIPQGRAEAIARVSLGSVERANQLLQMGLEIEALGGASFKNGFSKKEVFQISQRLARFRAHAVSRKSVKSFLDELKIHSVSDLRSLASAGAVKRLELIFQAERDLDSFINPALVLENLLLQC